MLKKTIIHFLRFLMCIIIGALSGIGAVSTWILYMVLNLDKKDNRYRGYSKINYGSFNRG